MADNPAQCAFAAVGEEMLNTLGYSDVVAVRSIRSALEQTARRQFAIALLSIVIDDGEINPVAQALDRQNVPFMLVSDLPDGRDRPPSLRMVPFVTKPYAFAELAAAMAGFERCGIVTSFPLRTVAGYSQHA